jgi:hypothetical protein
MHFLGRKRDAQNPRPNPLESLFICKRPCSVECKAAVEFHPSPPTRLPIRRIAIRTGLSQFCFPFLVLPLEGLPCLVAYLATPYTPDSRPVRVLPCVCEPLCMRRQVWHSVRLRPGHFGDCVLFFCWLKPRFGIESCRLMCVCRLVHMFLAHSLF